MVLCYLLLHHNRRVPKKATLPSGTTLSSMLTVSDLTTRMTECNSVSDVAVNWSQSDSLTGVISRSCCQLVAISIPLALYKQIKQPTTTLR